MIFYSTPALSPLSRKLFAENQGRFKAGFAVFVHTADKAGLPLLSGHQAQLLPRAALRQIADLELGEDCLLYTSDAADE